MREFSQKRKIRRILYSPLVLIILAIILFFIIKGSFGVYQKYTFSKDKLSKTESELSILREKKANIDNKIKDLETETGIEQEIRAKFDVAKEGEKLIVIVDDEKKEGEVVVEQGFWTNFSTTIKGWFQ